ncbi:Putative membrane protein [Amycolatopsis japonica]|uniref:Putative membrane protein n=1 Tax=Amycolatopsis japonica TaxID=208439 RepID=A0A075V6H5_9PSEU|nr:AI-2E family transporter [Amycolatopsis japonica]AIG78520.1 Putative membrane protein [Amycolatopsis japonica]
MLVVGATLYLLSLVAGYLAAVVVPVAIALLLAAMLTTGPLHLSAAQLRDSVNDLVTTLTNSRTGLTSGALSTAATVGGVLAQALLVLFVLIFLLAHGPGIWAFLLRAVPGRTRTRADVAWRRSLAALVNYVRATIAVGIGIGMAVLGVPLAVPLSALVFLGAFVPIIGSVVAGTVAVLIALVPAIATGLLVGGIAGALLAVPLLASRPAESGPPEPGLDREPEPRQGDAP